MTRAEFNVHENTPKVQAIQAAIRAGKPLAFGSQYPRDAYGIPGSYPPDEQWGSPDTRRQKVGDPD